MTKEMKKNYIFPHIRVVELEATDMMAQSFTYTDDSSATEKGGGDSSVTEDQTGGGDGLVKSQNLWDNEW